MMMNLDSDIALVTGASRGIGQAIALQLGRLGARVIGTATSEQGSEAITRQFKDEQITGHGLVLNVTDAKAIESVLAAINDLTGPPSILVNNAGITRDGLLMRMSEQDWQATLDTNLSAVFRLSKAVLRPMLKARYGRIINITSVVGSTGNPGQSNYAASKAGVVGFTKALAREVAARGITVNAVAPGFIGTDMTRDLPSAQQDSLLQSIPVNRLGTTMEIAYCVAFLAAREAAYITGETLHVNGGMHMS